MAKYGRFDPRNKKRSKDKIEYHSRGKDSESNNKRSREEIDEFLDDEDLSLYDKYRIEKFSNLF